MRAKYVIVTVIAAAVVAGCGDDHVTRPNIPTPSPYPVLLNPYAVLDALRIAYQNKDTLEMKVLYHDQYDGTSIDNTDAVPTLLHFTKADEVAHVVALARSTAIGSITVFAAPNSQRYDDSADPVGWATIDNPYMTIEISDATATHLVDVAHIAMKFKFIPTTPAPSSSTDTTWKIIRWTEVRNP